MWSSHQDGSAANPPTPEQREQWRRQMSPPEYEFPAGVGLNILLGRTDDAAVGLTHLEAFSTGFRFTLAARVRQPRPQFARGGLHMLISSHVHPGVDVRLEDRLLLGIEYCDGRRASTLTDMRMHLGAMTDSEQLVLIQQGGGGGAHSVDQSYWVAPLPPDGPVTVVLAWPGFGMPESRTILDAAAILAAASHRGPEALAAAASHGIPRTAACATPVLRMVRLRNKLTPTTTRPAAATRERSAA